MSNPTLRSAGDAADISRMLAHNAPILASTLFPNGKKNGAEWRIGSLHGEPGQSLGFRIAPGPKQGLWSDFSTGEKGDALDLVAWSQFNGSRTQALRWAWSWLGLDGRPMHKKAIARHVALPLNSAATDSPPSSPNAWREIWRQSTAASGSLAELYLRSRGLILPDDAPIRFHPACPHGAERLPAMVCLMTDPITADPCGTHRTFLRPDGQGKADVTPAKMMMGRAGIIRLVPDEDVTMGLGIAEGTETALAVIQHAFWSPVWAVTSAGGMAKFPVQNGIESLTIFADHDKVGTNGRRPGLDAAYECAKRWRAAGREVTIKLPPEGDDWDDYLRGDIS